MGILGFSFFVLGLLNTVIAQSNITDPNEVVAINKIIDHWNLRSKVNLSSFEPCDKNASWAPLEANPRIACDCSGTFCHINRLKIYGLDIVGEIPKELFVLKEMMDLNLAQNVLNGSVPPEIGQLTKMKWLSFGTNNLTGPIPPEIGNLSILITLSFATNNMNGPLPPELGNLTTLEEMYIDSNRLTGPIPEELSKLKNLRVLWASSNNFTGKLPEFLGSLTDLAVLRLEGTLLEGPIPKSYGALMKLDDLRIGDINNADSSLNFIENVSSISILSLRNCRIAGQLPEWFSKFSNLKILDLSFNKLTGEIPNSYKDFDSLEYLYLGSNNLSGELPANIITDTLFLDISFNQISGTIPANKSYISLNAVGTLITSEKGSRPRSVFLTKNSVCTKKASTSLSIKCGGNQIVTVDGIQFDDDSEMLGPASFYMSSNKQWAVSSSGIFINNPNGQNYTAHSFSQIPNTLDSELYKTARISPSSLRYYGVGLKKGIYRVELHFAEIQMDDIKDSWKGLGRRYFDVSIQGERVLRDFNVKQEAGGSKRALVKKFKANVTNNVLDIHFFWAGKGTCCIPVQSTFGPIVSAIHVVQEVNLDDSSDGSDKKRVGKIIGITLGSAAGVLIICSIFYVWWTKKKSPTYKGF
ncbi:PREDICTED: probable LRR receptor-like serine/threonine-protein kinase At1g56140 [Ipomoea nil]|uniref:probable LRR receptor-like serine/threonine-protein kinase At1g56140 n=1 Tax=Ipomoea nil TaxID=35883 RepID=UPI000900E3AE|nr:PREDICTED: probable LRR receptor-like serine/threonine-protein kinase At1g56140 [Ipomoea nil]XP_019163146.1 PREDICTED: probable LRR receptor-like serine/threonine-protein kinase At1g56140 [Ipomoea nil]